MAFQAIAQLLHTTRASSALLDRSIFLIPAWRHGAQIPAVQISSTGFTVPAFVQVIGTMTPFGLPMAISDNFGPTHQETGSGVHRLFGASVRRKNPWLGMEAALDGDHYYIPGMRIHLKDTPAFDAGIKIL